MLIKIHEIYQYYILGHYWQFNICFSFNTNTQLIGWSICVVKIKQKRCWKENDWMNYLHLNQINCNQSINFHFFHWLRILLFSLRLWISLRSLWGRLRWRWRWWRGWILLRLIITPTIPPSDSVSLLSFLLVLLQLLKLLLNHFSHLLLTS